jgi:hypothetical protein
MAEGGEGVEARIGDRRRIVRLSKEGVVIDGGDSGNAPAQFMPPLDAVG